MVPPSLNKSHWSVIGGSRNFWLYYATEGYDITHPPTPDAPKIYPRMTLKTQKATVVIDPTKTVLVIIDLQNYFVSPALHRPANGLGIQVAKKLKEVIIPSCRKAGISILWMGWGLTEQDVDEMPPTITRGFGFGLDTNFEDDHRLPELGIDIGPISLENNTIVEAGRVLMRDTWNSEFWSPLKEEQHPGDFYVWKNRLSGFWGGTDAENMLQERGIRTMLFAGVNTDQCVASSLMDATWRGYDCILLQDATSTTSPQFAQDSVEYNMIGWGFLMTTQNLVEGVVETEPETMAELEPDKFI